MREKSILLLTPPMGDPGGVQRYTETLTRALGDLLGTENVRRMSLPRSPRRRHEARLPWASKCRFVWRAVWEAARRRPDFIVCTHLGLAPIGWLLGRVSHRPYWVILYGIEAWRRLPRWKRVALRSGNRVIAISAFTREQVIRIHSLAPERLITLPCVLDEGLLRILPAEHVLGRWALERRRVVVTVGRLSASEQYKGHDVVLKALPQVIDRVPDLTYVIVGDGDDRPRLEAMAERLGVRSHVAFVGRLTDAELAACYRASEVFIMPARTILDGVAPKGEGFGIVFLEAMAFGKPVIGPNYGAPVEIIKNEQHGLFVEPADTTAVAQALMRLLNAPEQAAQMGESARQWVRREYSYESFCKRLREVLENYTSN